MSSRDGGSITPPNADLATRAKDRLGNALAQNTPISTQRIDDLAEQAARPLVAAGSHLAEIRISTQTPAAQARNTAFQSSPTRGK